MTELLIPAHLASVPANPVADILSRFGVNWASFGAAVLNFALVSGVLYYFALRPVLKTMDERNRKIADGLRFAEEMKARLAEVEKTCENRLAAVAHEASTMTHEASARAAAIEERAARDATAKADEIMRRANENIRQERARMLDSLRAEVATLVVQTTTKILARELSDAEKDRFNTAAAAEIERAQ
ncbi:MAG: F0F1 ATP synthase subunit B [Puniceicoccales bacterium]|jgi:F-type H+-transporting ATPase subunit b|nr:F0F1 ATP synthase subunit B [Puniceicoccales bacterium]